MVAVVLVSIGRTLSMKIKKFILELEVDAYLLDQRFREILYEKSSAEFQDALKGKLFIHSNDTPKYKLLTHVCTSVISFI